MRYKNTDLSLSLDNQLWNVVFCKCFVVINFQLYNIFHVKVNANFCVLILIVWVYTHNNKEKMLRNSVYHLVVIYFAIVKQFSVEDITNILLS